LPSSASSPSTSSGGSAAQPAQVGSRNDPTVASYLGESCANPSWHGQNSCMKWHDWAKLSDTGQMLCAQSTFGSRTVYKAIALDVLDVIGVDMRYAVG